MSVRRRLERLERTIATQWPRCRSCGGFAGKGVLPFQTIFESVPGQPDEPPSPTCGACGGPVEPDGRAPDDLLPPGSMGTVVYVEYERPRSGQLGDEPMGMNRRTPPGLPPA